LRTKNTGAVAVLHREEVTTKIAQLLTGFPEVVFAALIGSLATRGSSGHDIDIAVKVEGRDKYKTLARLFEELSDVLGVREEAIDIVDLDRADTMLKARLLEEAHILIDKKNYKEKLLKELSHVHPDFWEYTSMSVREWLKTENPPSLDTTLVKTRVDFIKSEIEFLGEYVLSKAVTDVKHSPVLSRLLERGYQLIIEALVDICRHIASAKGWRTAGTAKDYILECAKHGVLQASLAEELTHHVALRNIIIHRYLAVDHEKLYEESLKLVKHAGEFELHLREFIRKEAGDVVPS
jgi:uncharacterized protein YutE (UPF0331/DUF86 family)/predicted nucleotidyltransferase